MTEKIYLKNPYLRQLTVKVIDKQYKNNKYYITTDKTIFYPNLLDGQPRDNGYINNIELIDVFEKDNKIIHVINKDIDTEIITLSLDWDLRLDYMQQHTGQHLLSSVFYKLFNAETKEFHIGKDKLYIDVELQYISEKDILRIENFANKIIFSNFPIKTYYIEEKNKNLFEYKNNNIRIIEIENLDFTPCKGTHVRNTGEIGLVKITNYEKIDNIIRINFLCGNRVLKGFRESLNIINKINLKESIENKNLDNKIIYLTTENENLKDEIHHLKAENIINSGELYKNYNLINKYIDDLKDIDKIVNIIAKENNNILFLKYIENDNSTFIISNSFNVNLDTIPIINHIKNKYNCRINQKNNILKGYANKSDLENIMKYYFNNIINKL